MTTYRVIYQPTVFPRWRDFPDRAQAETYLAMALTHDAGAEIVEMTAPSTTDASGKADA